MAEGALHYVYDPLCGWCYAAAPLVDAVRAAGVPLVLHAGGLWAEPTHPSPAKAAYMRQSDARIAEMTGQVFGRPYLHGLLDDPDTLFWSLPPTAAVLAAGRLRPGAELDMLHAVQRAHYVEGRRVVDDAVLADLAAGIGLDRGRFAPEADAARLHIESSRRLMAQLGVQGFPSFLVETGRGLSRVPHEAYYGRPDAFAQSVAAAAAAARVG